MSDGYFVAYGFERTAAQLEKLARDLAVDLHPTRVYIDTRRTSRGELGQLRKDLSTVQGIYSITVIVHQKSDFGQGAKATQVLTWIKEMGHKVIWPNEVKRPRGRPKVKDLTPEQVKYYRELYSYAPWHHVAKRIEEDTGMKLTRAQVDYRLGRKKKKS